MITNKRYIQLVLITLGFLTLFLLLKWLLISAVDVLLLVFAGILFATFIRGMSRFFFGRFEKLPEKLGIGITLCLLVAVFSVFFIHLAPQLAEQVPELASELPKAIETLKEKTEILSWLGEIVGSGNGNAPAFAQEFTGKALSFFANTFGVVSGLFVIFFVGLYLCFTPFYYLNGIFCLLPPSARERADEVFHALDYTLSHWLVGRFVGMLVVSISTYVGLLVLGIPLPLSLAVLAGLLTFIPNLGPILSGLPPVLLGYMESPTTALYVILLYLTIQAIESYIITPLIQQREVSLPPLLTLTSQILFVKVFGFLGLLLATPLTAVVMVLVQMLYVEQVLGEPVQVPAADEEAE